MSAVQKNTFILLIAVALIAGFQHAQGKNVITLDADLQNPPEEIPAILAEMDKGFDYVGTAGLLV